jgi:hypothetical protein
MRVKQVEYRKLVSDGNYNNVTYGCVIELAEGESDGEAISEARALVEGWHGRTEALATLENECRRLKQAKINLDYEAVQAKGRVLKLREMETKIRERLGLEAIMDDIPF